MGQWPLISSCVFVIASFLVARISATETKFITNCTADDLRNINQQYENLSSSSLNFVFSHCDLSSVPNGFFENVSGLQSIEFQFTTISSIDSNALNGLTKLQVLRFFGNTKLTAVQVWAAKNLNNLSELDLHNNSISRLEKDALRRYPNLKHLDLAHNFVGEVPVGLLDLSFNLVTLNLAHNELQRIESDAFKALLRLVDLNLAHNRIDYIDPYAFSTTTLLKLLHLNGNRIKSISSIIFFNLNRLEFLNLSTNAFEGSALEEDTFKQNLQLLHLDLSHNAISAFIPTTFTGLHSLQVLNGSHNQIVSIGLKDLDKLRHLDISFNKLTRLFDNQFAASPAIESLNVSHNDLDTIQQFTFTDLSALRTLDLSANRLHGDEFLDLAAPIKIVRLQNNRYHEINLSALNSIGMVYVNDNPWNCTWLLNALALKEHLTSNIQFGWKFEGVERGNGTKPLVEELDCFDYRQSSEAPTVRRIVIVNSLGNKTPKDTEVSKKKWPTIGTYPRTFNKLLSDEFDYKACLLWTVVAVFIVIGFVRLGKYCLDQSEKKSERYRMVQQEKVLKDIDDYFAKHNRRQRT